MVTTCCCHVCQVIYAWLISVCPGGSNEEGEHSPSAGRSSTWVHFILKKERMKEKPWHIICIWNAPSLYVILLHQRSTVPNFPQKLPVAFQHPKCWVEVRTATLLIGGHSGSCCSHWLLARWSHEAGHRHVTASPCRDAYNHRCWTAGDTESRLIYLERSQ